MLLAGFSKMKNQGTNQLIIAAAGSGKTTHIIKTALEQVDKNILITTYTRTNRDEIINRIIELKGFVPANIEIETWFGFLFRHGVKPYQGSQTSKKIKGIVFVNSLSAMYISESIIQPYYFHEQKIYSDKLSKFTLKCDDATGGSVFSRMAGIYDAIFIDEVQDMCGYDLDVISKLFNTTINVTLVGDPRQATYTTHPDNKYKKYKKGGIVNFIRDNCSEKCTVDYSTLNNSHRNHSSICNFSSLIFPEYDTTSACICTPCRAPQDQTGIFLVPSNKVEEYKQSVNPIILRYSGAEYPEWNFGLSKGKTFNHTLIYPTGDFENYLIDGELEKQIKVKGKITYRDRFDRSKLYVASTRARYSVGIVCNEKTLQRLTEIRLAKLNAKVFS